MSECLIKNSTKIRSKILSCFGPRRLQVSTGQNAGIVCLMIQDLRFTSGLPAVKSIPVTTPWTGIAKPGEVRRLP